MGAAGGHDDGERVGDSLSLVHNERLKLLATLLNTIAAATFVVGAFTPFAVALIAGGGATVAVRGVLIGICWIVACALLHGAARLVLGGLRE